MGLYGFKTMFVDKILAGEKTHTIRATRKHQDKPGDTMHLYTGLRQKGARLLMRVPCVKVESIRIEVVQLHPAEGLLSGRWGHWVWIDGTRLEPDEREALARRDGFNDFSHMMSFWEGRLPFHGHIFHWAADTKSRLLHERATRKKKGLQHA